MNKLVVIGYVGQVTAYLNVERAEAVRRYRLANPGEGSPDPTDSHWDGKSKVEEILFEEQFGGYDIFARP
ncbi:hypothetical protein ACFQ4C_21580 [Larkinella insperata]|uniref:Single-stranded DNA-binding protein n=2 Tax=Larkinella insperata TaxID=332158 RepID=A0ABW3QBN8_9BACT